MSKNKVNILLTCIGHKPKKFFLQQLKKNSKYDLKIIGTDINSNIQNRKYVDFFYKVPSGFNKNFNNKIFKICLEHKINIILPGADEEVLSLINNKKKFDKINCFLPFLKKELLNKISNKISLCKFMKKLEIPFYKWNVIKNYKNLEKIISVYSENSKKCVVKPPLSRGGRDVFILVKENIKKNPSKGAREIHLNYNFFLKNFKKYKLNFPLLVTDNLNPPVHDVDILSYKGILKKIVIRKRKISSDSDKGHIIIKNSKILNYCKSIVKKMNLSYLVDFDIMFDNLNNPRLLEINQRMSGSIAEAYKGKIYLIDHLIDVIKKK